MDFERRGLRRIARLLAPLVLAASAGCDRSPAPSPSPPAGAKETAERWLEACKAGDGASQVALLSRRARDERASLYLADARRFPDATGSERGLRAPEFGVNPDALGTLDAMQLAAAAEIREAATAEARARAATWAIERVEESGDSAIAVLRGPGGAARRLRFVREDGAWRLDGPGGE
jgi:hypothetical protein